MWTIFVVVGTPCFDGALRVFERQKLMHVQALVAQPPVEGFNMPVVRRLARSGEVECNAALVRPGLERFGHELRAVIDGDRLWQSDRMDDAFERGHDALSCE